MIAPDAPSLYARAQIILNLNEPNKLGDVSWVKPMKYVGIWWGMHLDRKTWNSGPKHGATTAYTKQMIDFAAKNGFGGVLVEGWNKGWDGDWFGDGWDFSFTEAYPDFDIARSRRLRAVEGRRPHRAPRDRRQHRQLREAARAGARPLSAARHSRGEDRLCRRRRRHSGRRFRTARCGSNGTRARRW